jgi:hypothetical protein
MRKTLPTAAAALLFVSPLCAAVGPSSSGASEAPRIVDLAPVAPAADTNSAVRADRRYDEMLGKMRSAIEEVAELYGNPVFLQIFTNDAGRAAELKQRLTSVRGAADSKKEIAELERKRDELRDDIALKEREAARLASRLIRQRAALDALATAIDQARTAVEDTTK